MRVTKRFSDVVGNLINQQLLLIRRNEGLTNIALKHDTREMQMCHECLQLESLTHRIKLLHRPTTLSIVASCCHY